MSKGLFDYILDSIFDSDWVGRRGEKLTEKELNLVKLFGRNGKVLRNIYVPKQNGETSEIDVVFITQKGIFVIESKNCSGGYSATKTPLNGHPCFRTSRRTVFTTLSGRTELTSSGWGGISEKKYRFFRL